MLQRKTEPEECASIVTMSEVAQLPLEDIREPDQHSINSAVSKREEKPKKRSGKTNFLRALWATKETENISDRRIFAKTSLRELVIYSVFVVLILLVTLLMVNNATYFYYTSVFELVVGTYTDTNGTGIDLYNNIKDMKDVWEYIKLQVFDALYWDTWYNQRNVSFNERELIGLDNKLLGVPRLRQIRVDPSGCNVPEQMTGIVSKCYPAYSPSTESTKSFTPKGGVTPVYTMNAWKHQTAAEVGSTFVDAQIGLYEGSGFVQDLSRSRNHSLAIVEELIQGRWLDEASRVLFLDFTIYNANINMFVIVKIIFEMPYTGGVFVSNDLQPAKLVRYLTAKDHFVMACEIMCLIFVLYYIIEEILEIKQQGFRYFAGIWNLLDIVVVILTLTCAGFTIYTTVTATSVMNKLLEDISIYPHFDRLSYWYGHFIRAIALCVFLVVIKIFKYINFDQSLGQLTKTLSVAAFDLIGFMVMFCIIFFAFGQFGYLAFGAGTDGFRSFTQACYTLFRMMVGDIDFAALQRAHFILGPLFFVLFIFFAVFVLLNMFLAIVNDAYASVKEELVKQRTQLKLKDMVKRSAKEMFNMMRKKSTKSLVQILRAADLFDREVIPFDEYRMALKKYGYGDTEIASTFIKYDADGDNCLNIREQRIMEDEIEIGVNKAFKPPEEDEGHGTDDEATEEGHTGTDEIEYVDPQDYKELVERVEALETSVINMLSHGDQLLAMLEQVELAKREHRKNLMEMFDTLAAKQRTKEDQ
ncbi:hypothetical protein EG68_08195 [Paragonimus skrjabini miyazakii]|uniref:Uncharacterized protein n=1 Tax=Paragonimus skrjabini miyazakii TaxID=59628 RepID=A0A8S9YKY0_9TREM|nr:hypothetical protein EG68_08195 [Paragonimus skrjabini miyazakii]